MTIFLVACSWSRQHILRSRPCVFIDCWQMWKRLSGLTPLCEADPPLFSMAGRLTSWEASWVVNRSCKEKRHHTMSCKEKRHTSHIPHQTWLISAGFTDESFQNSGGGFGISRDRFALGTLGRLGALGTLGWLGRQTNSTRSLSFLSWCFPSDIADWKNRFCSFYQPGPLCPFPLLFPFSRLTLISSPWHWAKDCVPCRILLSNHLIGYWTVHYHIGNYCIGVAQRGDNREMIKTWQVFIGISGVGTWGNPIPHFMMVENISCHGLSLVLFHFFSSLTYRYPV